MKQQSGLDRQSMQWIERLRTAISNLLSRLGEGRLGDWAGLILLLGLFILGAVHWAYFLDYGRITFDLHDWVQEGWRYTFLQKAIQARQLPLHVSTPFSDLDRFIARPDTVLSPQVLLLEVLSLGRFVLANTLLLYAAGFAGLLLLRKRYGLSPVPFSTLFLLFNFNGHITAHLAVGHSMYVGYFLFPFFIYLVLKLLEDGGAGWAWVTQLAVLLFVLFLQGAFHQFIWCLMFLGTLALFQPRYAGPLLKGLFFSLLLSMPRILPPVLEFGREGVEFNHGFLTLADLLAGLVILKHPVQALSDPLSILGWWEMDHYVGLVGFAFLLYFGLYLTWKLGGSQRLVLGPSAVLAFLSIGHIYMFIHLLPLPLTDSERVTSRFLILPLVFLFVLGAVRLESFLRLRRSLYAGAASLSLVSLALLALLAHDLLQHSRFWRFTNMYQLFPNPPIQLLAEVVQRSDPPYILSLIVGSAAALLALLYLLIQVRREKAGRGLPEGSLPPA